MRSLERYVVVGLALALLAVFGLLFWAAGGAVRSLSEAYVAARLEHDAEALLGALRVGQRGQVHLREGRITPIYQQPLSGHYFQLALADGSQVRSRSLWDERLPEQALQPGEVVVTRAPGPGQQTLLLRAAGYAKDDLRVTLTVAEDLAPLARDIRAFQRFALGALLAALIVIVVVQRYVLRRGFRALDTVRDEVREIATGARQRLDTLGPVEIHPVTSEVNRLLDRLQQRLQRSREALGNLAHALKTPLTLLTRTLDAVSLPSDDKATLQRQLDRIHALVERELKTARFAGDGALQPFVPAQQVPDLLDALRQLYRERRLDIRAGSLPDVPMPFDREDMLELLGNLLDNACKWARSRVVVDVRLDGGAHFRVADDGPGIAQGERAGLLLRGSRLDEQEDGHGLGLSIVNGLVRDYRGRMDLAEADGLGGLEVRVFLPIGATVPDAA